MAKVTFVFTDDRNTVDIDTVFEPAVPMLVSERTLAQSFALRVSQFITDYGKKYADGLTVELEDDSGNTEFKSFANGVEVKPDESSN
jgi:phage protein D